MLLGLGVGIIVSSLTTKYRDLAIAVGFGAVSYTHLDVYKRQVLDESNEKIGYKIRQAQQVDRVPYMLVPVSYTHLDVYKRQSPSKMTLPLSSTTQRVQS